MSSTPAMSDALGQIAKLEARNGALERESNVALIQIAELEERIRALELLSTVQERRRWARTCSCGHPATTQPPSRSRSSGRADGGGGGAAASSWRAEPCRPNPAQSQTVDPGPPPPPENSPPQTVVPPPTPPPCTHHTQGNAYANRRVTISALNRARNTQELEKLFASLGSTLFWDDASGLDALWWRVEAEVANKRIAVQFCGTQANRTVLIRCCACEQQVFVEHGNSVPPERYPGLRGRLFGFFDNPRLVVNQGPARQL